MTDLDNRRFLRNATRALHEAVDDRFARLAPDRSGDYVTLLRAMRAVFGLVNDAAAAWPGLPTVTGIISRLDDDLHALRAAPLDVSGWTFESREAALGALYVLAGSHFGKAVMRERWAASDDPAVRRARAYLADDSLALTWRDVRQQLDDVGPGADGRAELLRGARRVFGALLPLYHLAGLPARPPPAQPPTRALRSSSAP